MRNFDEYKIKSTVTDTEHHFTVSLNVYDGKSEVAKIYCFYLKGDGTLVIGDIDTVPRYKRKGLGLLRIQETLKILEEKNFKVSRVMADVEGWPPSDQTREIAESFFKSLGFEWVEEYNWLADVETLKKKLKEKM